MTRDPVSHADRGGFADPTLPPLPIRRLKAEPSALSRHCCPHWHVRGAG
jgi:hypothetical protein